MPNIGKVKDQTLFDWKLDELPKWQAVPLKICQDVLTSEKLIYSVFALCFVPCVVFTLVVVVQSEPKMTVVTYEEQMIIIHEERLKCEKTTEQAPGYMYDSAGKKHTVFCKQEFDNFTCWPNSLPGEYVSVNCPAYIEDFNSEAYAHRICDVDGNWKLDPVPQNPLKRWADYNNCWVTEFEALNNTNHEDVKMLMNLYTVGYSFSLVALVIAMSILCYFKRLHCTRNYIHMHLFASFILKAVVIFIKDALLYKGAAILDVISSDFDDVIEKSFGGKVLCKVIVAAFHYFMATNFFWVLVEGLYLHSLIFVTFFSDKKYLWRFIVTGWGLPLCFVIPWAIVRAIKLNYGCWDIAVPEYRWIYNGPIIVANVINFMLFVNIVRVLWYKMRRGICGQPEASRQYKKLAKSTLVLIPMFGAHAIVFIGLPDSALENNQTIWKIRMFWDLFFNSFQGFFVAIIYCFTNSEVQAEFKRAWDRFYTTFEIQRGQRERSRSSVTMLATFSSVSQLKNGLYKKLCYGVRHSTASQYNNKFNVEINELKQQIPANLKETSAVSASKPVTKIKNQEKSAQQELSSKKDEIILKNVDETSKRSESCEPDKIKNNNNEKQKDLESYKDKENEKNSELEILSAPSHDSGINLYSASSKTNNQSLYNDENVQKDELNQFIEHKNESS